MDIETRASVRLCQTTDAPVEGTTGRMQSRRALPSGSAAGPQHDSDSPFLTHLTNG